jgi:type II secretory pathway pseudopilin PulG
MLESIHNPSVLKPVQGILAGAILGLLLLVGLASLGIASDFIKEHQFESAAQREAQLAAADGREEGTIRNELLQKAQSLGLPIREDSIKIDVTPPEPNDEQAGNLLSLLGVQKRSTTTGHVYIDVTYDVPYRFPGGIKLLHFHFAVNDRGN